MSSARVVTTDAIVLRARNLGEADRIVTLFTAARGKVDAVAKGARRPGSALGGRLAFLSEARVTLHRGRSLDVVTQAAPLVSSWDRLVGPATFAPASLVAELIDGFCEPELPLPEVYDLTRNVVAAMARGADAASLIPRFQLRLLDALGLAPAADACVRCNGTVDDGAWVDLDGGGLGCATCYGGRGDAHAFEAADVASFRAVGAPRGEGAALVATPRVARAVDDLIAYQLGKRPKARALFDALGA